MNSLVYTGPRLGQFHALVYQALMTLVIERNASPSENARVAVNRRELLKVLGCLDHGKKARDHVLAVLKDFQAARVELETRTHIFSDVLVSSIELDKKTGALAIEIPRRAVSLFCDEITAIDLRRKRGLGKSPLTLWLHDFLSSQSNELEKMKPWRVKDLSAWSGSSLQLKKFRAALKTSAASLAGGSDPLLKSWHINAADQLVYVKTATTTRILDGKEVKAVREAQERQTTAENAARAQRARILL